MGALSGFFASGAAADIILLVMAGEFILLLRAGRAPWALLAALLPGALIVLAMRGALVGADWWWIALPLALSLPAHLTDLRARGWLRRNGTSLVGKRLRAVK